MDRIKNIKFTKKLVIKIVLLSPLVLLAILLLVVRPIQVRLEQRDFRAAEAYLEEKKNEIERLAGPAESVEKENSCSYASALVGKGQLYCNVRNDMIYSVSTADEANILVNRISADIGTSNLNWFGEETSKFKLDTTDNTLSQNAGGISGISCNIYYQLESEENSLLTVKITHRCSDEAMTKIYPVKER